MPPRTELVERFHVTRTTVDRAISELIGKGYLTSKIGSGTYVVKARPAPGAKPIHR
ncbi:MAG: GntR family transcriptional regulator [[Clostridium] leptum]